MREEGSSTIESEAETEAEYQERFQQMAEHIQEIFWMLDAHTKQVLYVSLAYERVCGRACASMKIRCRTGKSFIRMTGIGY